MLGKIISIEDDIVRISPSIDMTKQENLINIHVVFESNDTKIVGEITDMTINTFDVTIYGEIKDNKFVMGIDKKPSFKSLVRIIKLDELSLILGEQILTKDKIYFGLSSVYRDYKINIGINDFFSNHFTILGNTGSGKSCSVAKLLQNIFDKLEAPKNSNIFLFDAYGEYENVFVNNEKVNFKNYTTNVNGDKDKILRIPTWLLEEDDLALLLEADQVKQLPIIEKTLNLVNIFSREEQELIVYKNDIIARTVLDILLSGEAPSMIRDQIYAILTTYKTKQLNLDSEIFQLGYTRSLKQCLFIDNTGKIADIELIVDFIKTFISEGLDMPNNNHDLPYTLSDIEKALNFALMSEGIYRSDAVYDYANILSVRLHSLVNSDASEFFNYPKLVTKEQYIEDFMHTYDGKKCQIVNFNINYLSDKLSKTTTKIISKMLFDVSIANKNRANNPFHIIIEEAHRYVQNDNDIHLLGYNIFDRITKEGRKYGVLLGLISQRPKELSETAISQCSNFIIFRTLHPADLEYIKNMVPNVSTRLFKALKTLQPGNCIAFGNAFKIPLAMYIEKPNPEPLSRNADIVKSWYQ